LNKLVSVIIPVTQNDPHLTSCLRAIRRSTYKNVETIVVDEGLERSAQRNIGMSRAKGEYFLFLDSDQEVSYDLIEDCVRKINGYVAVNIPERVVTKGFFGRLRDWERQFYTGTCIDVPRFVKRGCPHFDEQQHGTEDSDWARRLHPPFALSESCFYHNDGVNLWSYLKKKSYYAKSMKRFRDRNPQDKIYNFWWRCFGVYFENGKWRMVLRKPHYFICLMGLVFIRGIIYIWFRQHHEMRRIWDYYI